MPQDGGGFAARLLPPAPPRLATMLIRELTAEDFFPYRRLTTAAFGGRLDETQPPSDFPGQIALGIDATSLPDGAEGILAAGARIREDRITLGGGVARCGGIAGLAVHPAHRGDSLFDRLLTSVLARCTQEGMAFSMLYPSHPGIYRRLGYQVVSQVPSLIVPLVDLQRIRPLPGRRLVAVTEATMPRLHALYRELSATENGMLLREGPLFPSGLPGGGWQALLLVDEEGRDHGYLSLTRAADRSDEVGISVHEVLGRTRADRLELLRSIGSWSTVTELARLRVSGEDPLLDALPGGRFRPESVTVPLVMMRLTDTVAALSARPAPPGLTGSIRLTIDDATVPAGTTGAAGSFEVSAAGGRTQVARVDGASADSTGPAGSWQPGAMAGTVELLGTVRLDIHAASLLLSGGRSLADAARLGLAVSADPDAGAFLDTLLAGPRPRVMDTF